MAKRPLILVTNDDGINAPGLEYLVNMSMIGDVIIVAPDSQNLQLVRQCNKFPICF